MTKSTGRAGAAARSRGVRGVGTMGALDNSIEQRIGRHIQPQANGCWLYNGDPYEYHRWSEARTGEAFSVHRFVYETMVGPIDEGCHVHHRCESPGCCNPEHLIVLTPKEHKAVHTARRRFLKALGAAA